MLTPRDISPHISNRAGGQWETAAKKPRMAKESGTGREMSSAVAGCDAVGQNQMRSHPYGGE
jgi:hypothetical protein